MKILLNPRWLFAFGVAPGIILIYFFNETFAVISPLLDDESVGLWTRYAWIMAAIVVIQTGHATVLLLKGKKVSLVYGLTTLGVYISLLYRYYHDVQTMVPWDIPRWMLPEDLSIFAGTFLMPAIAHALAVVVVRLTPTPSSPWVNAVGIVLAPLALYFFVTLILPLRQKIPPEFETHLIAVVVIGLSVAFLFFVTRLAYILVTRHREKVPTGVGITVLMRLLVVMILPLAGITLNTSKMDNIFGDFSAGPFLLLAIVNGVVVALPEASNRSYRLLLFAARCATFTFTLYFFLVFLPWLPFSVIAVLVYGAGILMMTPTILMILQTHLLSVDFRFLRNHYSVVLLVVIAGVSVSIIPSSVLLKYYADRHTLNQALSFIYEPDFSIAEDPRVDALTLKQVVSRISANKLSRSRNSTTPFLSTAYNAIVLDNLTLSQEKIKHIEDIFDIAPENSHVSLFQVSQGDWPNERDDSSPRISDYAVRSTYNGADETWVSEVDLRVENPSAADQSEFVTTFTLPEGCWISDYYLVIGGKKEHGILAEKKAATWIYQQVTNERRDPGLLSYVNSGAIMLRVFPFGANEARSTGFTVVHKEPAEIKLDGHTIRLGDRRGRRNPLPVWSADGNTVYFPAEVKRKLPRYQRKPYYHFVIDCSAGNSGNEFATRIRAFQRKQPLSAPAAYTLVNGTTSTFRGVGDLDEILAGINYEGGFFLERAIQKILFTAYHDMNERPVIVVVTNHPEDAIVPSSFGQMAMALPETDHYFTLGGDGIPVAHSLTGRREKNQNTVDNFEVVAWPDAMNPQFLLRNDGHASIRIKGWADNALQPSSGKWLDGLALRGKWLSHTFFPQHTPVDWPSMVRASFASHILTPMTAFLSLENEAQKRMLWKKQEEVLNGEKFHDIGEEARMSEPGFFAVLLLMVLFVGFYKKKSVLRFR